MGRSASCNGSGEKDKASVLGKKQPEKVTREEKFGAILSTPVPPQPPANPHE
jgi:hypothetical protein